LRRPHDWDPKGSWRLAIAVGGVSTSAPILRWAGGPPLVVAAGRMLLAFLLVLPGALALWRRQGIRGLGIDRRVGWPMALATVFLTLHFGTWTASVYLTSIASSVVLVNATPILVLAGEALLWHRATSGRQWLGASFALVGIAVMAGFDGLTAGPKALDGDLLALAGAATYAVYVMASARVRTQVSTPVQVAVLYGGCFAGLGTATLIADQAWRAPQTDPRMWVAFALLALLPTTLGHTMVQSILDRVRPAVIAIALLGEPVGASILAWLALGQKPALVDVLGGLLTLVGIAWALWPGRVPAPVPNPAAQAR